MLTLLLTLLFYISFVFMVAGVIVKIREYSRTPAPLTIPTMPAPRTEMGVVFRMIREVALFESLFRSNKWIWVLGYMFHAGMFLVLVRHMRYFQDPVWDILFIAQPFGVYAGFVMLLGLVGLLARRFLVERIRYISTPSDYLILLLLIGIVLSGLLIKFAVHTDIVAFKEFTMGLVTFDLLTFDWHPVPADPLVIIHLLLVIVLMFVFPISKLLHVPGVFFSPTRTQADDSREKRRLAPWAAKLEQE